ncbi:MULTISPECIES: hypothetical protein [Streptomyces]|uniref:hypothetical protein n=1 Tax=Streptomyces TaxID=1883 RepID=UPI00345B8DAA
MTTTDDICDICAVLVDCACDGDDPGCWTCGGQGEYIPDHCCACGGSPYCQCCPTCRAECIGSCTCPVTVTLADGTTKTLPPADEEEHEEPDFRDDEPAPEPPEDYYDDEVVAAANSTVPEGSYSNEPPFPADPPVPTDDLPDWPPF